MKKRNSIGCVVLLSLLMLIGQPLLTVYLPATPLVPLAHATTLNNESPLNEGFEHPWPPEGWALVEYDGSHWVQDNVFHTPHSGNYSAYANKEPGNQADCWLITPRLEFTASDLLQFWYTTREYHTNYSRLEVRLSLGLTQKDIDAFTILLWDGMFSNNNWQQQNITIRGFTGYTGYIGFHVIRIDDFSDPIFIDDVLGPKKHVPSHDVGPTALNKPAPGATTGTYQINITVKNYGMELQSFPIKCTIFRITREVTGAVIFSPIYENISTVNNLGVGETKYVVFPQPWTVTYAGYYAFNVSCAAVEDENRGNDYFNRTLYITPPNVEGLTLAKHVWDPLNKTWVKHYHTSQGDTIRMRLRIINPFTTILTPVEVSDILPLGLEYAGQCTLNGDDYKPDSVDENITWTLGVILGKGSANIEFDVTVTGCGLFTNNGIAIGYLVQNNEIIGYSKATDNASITATDTDPPSTTLTFEGPFMVLQENVYLSNHTTIVFTSTDACTATSTYYRIHYNDQWSIWNTYTKPFVIQEECKHVIEYHSVDMNNNTETTKTQTIFVDTTPPQTSYIPGSPNYTAIVDNETQQYITLNTTIELIGSDPLNCSANIYHIHYSIENETTWTGWETGKQNDHIVLKLYQFEFTKDGPYTMVYYAIDGVENIEPPTTLVLIVDELPPITSLEYNGPWYIDTYNTTWISNITSLTLSADDQGVPPCGVKEIRYAIGGADAVPYEKPLILDTQGSYLLTFHSSDNLDNKESAQRTTLNVDIQPPQTSLTYEGPRYLQGDITWITSETTIVFSAHDFKQCGVNTTYYQVDNGSILPYQEPFTIPWEGTHTIRYYSTDHLGTQEPINIKTIVVHNQNPAFNIDTPKEGWLHLFGRKIIPVVSRHAMIIGKLTASLSISSNITIIDKALFAIDGNERYTDTKPPYEWTLEDSLLFTHTLSITVVDKLGHYTKKNVSIFIITL